MTGTLTRMTAEESRAWIALITTAELLPAALDAQLRQDAGLTHYEFMLLSTLMRSGAMRLSDMAAATNASLPRASKVARRLQERELVEREEDAADRRGVRIRLTGEGRRKLVRATPGHFDAVRRLVLDRVTEEQLQALSEILTPIIAGLDPQRRFGPARR